MRLPKSFSMAVAKSLAKISFFVYGRHGPRGCAAFRFFEKIPVAPRNLCWLWLLGATCRSIRVPTGFIPDFAQAMSLSGRDIDLPFVSSYNNCMKIKLTGFFRPDHDPPQKVFLVL